MPRPSAKQKNVVSLAIAELRRHLHESQQAFSIRLGTSQAVLGRFETGKLPGPEMLQRLLKIAEDARHSSAIVFAFKSQPKIDFRGVLDRMEQARSIPNIVAVGKLLQQLFDTHAGKWTEEQRSIFYKIANRLFVDFRDPAAPKRVQPGPIPVITRPKPDELPEKDFNYWAEKERELALENKRKSKPKPKGKK